MPSFSFSSKCPAHKMAAIAVAAGMTLLIYKGVEAVIIDGWAPRCRRKHARRLLACINGVPSSLAERMKVATGLALKAGEAMRSTIDKAKSIEHKGLNDMVTATDKDNEKLIFEGLRSSFSTDMFIGEESSAANNSIAELTDDYTWIVDPIDGTTNFVHGFPMTCVSIGLTYKKQVILGIIYDPLHDEMFQAIRGHGAWLNGTKIKVSGRTELSQSLIINEYGYQREEKSVVKMLDCSKAMLYKCRGLRQTGSGAMDLAYVACGRIDGIYSGVAGEGWKPWDYAAGVVIVEEAGGVMATLEQKKFDLFGSSILCTASKSLAAEIVAVLKGVNSSN